MLDFNSFENAYGAFCENEKYGYTYKGNTIMKRFKSFLDNEISAYIELSKAIAKKDVDKLWVFVSCFNDEMCDVVLQMERDNEKHNRIAIEH